MCVLVVSPREHKASNGMYWIRFGSFLGTLYLFLCRYVRVGGEAGSTFLWRSFLRSKSAADVDKELYSSSFVVGRSENWGGSYHVSTAESVVIQQQGTMICIIRWSILCGRVPSDSVLVE